MELVSSALMIISGVYFALGLMYLRFWWDERSRRDYLAFAITCLAYMLHSWFELGMMHAASPEEYLFYAWRGVFSGNVAVTALAWFAYLHLRGRKWLFVAYCSSRILAVGIHLIMENGINFRRINAVGQNTILGEALSYPIAVPNPWMIIPHLSHVLMIVFLLDASVRSWRGGERRQALLFGAGTILFGVTILVFSLGVLWGLAPIPLASSFGVLFIIGAMLYQLNYDMHRAAMLTETLRERDAQLTDSLEHLELSAAAANVGMWSRKIGEDEMWVSEKASEIWGFPRGEQFTRAEIIQHIHPDDQDQFRTLAREVEAGKNEFQLEYRILLPDGDVRWVHPRGKVEMVNGSRLVRGAIVDITKLKLAEEAIHDLGGKLMNAQEKERARLARELHDDLTQSIALLSIQLSSLRNEPKDIEHVRDQLDRFVHDVQRLSVDVHRISHELHPAKLTMLGLKAALGGFCRELAAAHGLYIDFEADDMPRDMPQDIALCLYRVTQESLQNVIKHSRAARASVSIRSENGGVRLSVYDSGNGFDLSATKAKEGIGLSSIEERVRAVKGTFRISSNIGSGTEIEVLIPFKHRGKLGDRSDHRVNNNSNVKIESKRIRVLVADNYKPMLETIVGLLTPRFEIVGTAADGKTALEMIDRLKPDIAVLDISMSFKTGIEIAADLTTIAPEVKVVIVSATDDESYVDAARTAGAVAYVTKTRLADGLVPAVEGAYAGNIVI